jgi:hypothetical protein
MALWSTKASPDDIVCAMASVKGILIRAMSDFLRSNYGADNVTAATNALPPEEGALLQRRFLDGSMYPFETMVALRRVMRQVAAQHKDAPALLGAYLAESVFSGAFKPLLAGDPVTMVGKVSWIKNFFYDDYDIVEAAMTGPSACRLVYHYEEGLRPTRAVCLSLGRFWARTLELSGAGSVATTHGTCLCEGGDRCEFAFTW